MVSPSTSLTWASTSTSAIGYALEIPEAAAGTYTLTANTVAVTLTGSSATTKVDRNLSANTAAISLTGSSATLTYTPVPTGYVLTANTAAVSLSGASATLKVGRKVQTGSGSVSLQGGAATLSYSGEVQTVRRGDDAPSGRLPAFVPEIPELAEIEEVIQAEIKRPRTKTRKVKREVTQQIIRLAGLFAEDMPPVVYRQVDKAITRIENNADDHLLYAAIQLAIIKAIEAEEEDEMMMLLMVA
ncbi:hypothetical protein CO661_14170 [Sinorhizobium fredii]|uniref:Uncharacterized protein n=2 Tax=Rhizobium fredii TaxID=380 RepID=A0A2A6LXP6_RHIFR|nr:hypothetical protein CO661_14170 [Sinorhizobium fredii]